MMVSLATNLLGRFLLGASFVLGVFRGVQARCYLHQRRGKLLHTHPSEDLPRLSPERALHPRGHLRHLQGQVIP